MGYKVTVITCFLIFHLEKYIAVIKINYLKKRILMELKLVWSYITKNEGFVKRIIDYSSYGLGYIWSILKTDYIIATSPHFLVLFLLLC